MPIYKLNGEVYDIPEDVVADFEKDNPNATVTYNANGDEYDIPVSERDSFLKDFPDAALGSGQAVAEQEPAEQKPTPTDQAFDPSEFQQTINSARQTVGKTQQAVNRIGNMQQRMGLDLPQEPIRLGQNKKVTKGEQRFNLDKGEMEQTYVTESGNEYNTRAAADLEQNAVDDAMRRELNPITTQIEDLEAEQRRIEELLQQSVDEQYSNKGLLDRIGAAGLGSPSTRDFRDASDYLLANPKARDLMAAYRKNREALTILEDQRDQKTNEFWHSLGTEISNGYNFSLGGSTRIDDIAALNRASKYKDIINEKNSRGEELTNEERVAEAVLKNAAWDQHVQSEYGDNYGAWARAGKMGAVSADFMLDFLMGGGLPAGLAKSVMNGIVKGGTKLAGNIATKGLGKYMLKATGATLGSMVAGAGITNTLQIGKTAADIGNMMMGDVYRDAQGNYVFGHYKEDNDGNPVFVQGGNDFLDALITAERNGTAENASEILGEFLPGGSQVVKVLDKIGLSRISRGLTALKGKRWYQGYQKFLQTAGFHGVPGEGMEEYAGTFLDALMGGDEWKNHKDPKTHIDIWLGVTTMGAILGTPNIIGTGYSAVQYQRYKKKLGMSDAHAGSVISPEKWSQLKEQIDGTTNDNMADMVMSILSNDDLSDDGKRAAMGYVSDLQKMRGYSLASAAAGRTEDGQDAEPSQSDEIDQSYTEGYDTQEPDIKKQYVDEELEAASNLPQYGDEFAKIVTESQNPVETLDYLMQNRDSFTDDQIAAAADYFQKKARAQGVMDAALDGVDLEVEKANDEVRSNTHQATGNVITAQVGDGAYYIIGGDVTTDEVTGMPVVTGTGGAVVVKDAMTGEVSVKPAGQVVVTSTTPADDMIQYNENVLRQQLTQQADDDITYGSPASEVFDLEDTVTLQDGEGGLIEGQVVTLPNAVDGVFVIQTADGRALQMTADDINRRIVAHNGQEVQRNVPETGQNVPNAQEYVPQTPENVPYQGANGENVTQSGVLDNATGEGSAAAEDAGQESTQPQSALSRIPVRTDKEGQPLKNKKGRPILDWHKASVEDAAAALIETTGGNMVMARDTASDLVRQSQDRKEKIAKQKPKGEDPIEIAESRMEIQQQIDEQQAIIKQWQDVGAAIRKQMETAEAERRAAEEAAKSEEQKAREAEEARIRKEKQDAIDAERRRKKIEEEIANWNKPYAPLVKARKEMEGDQEAQEILSRTS